MILEFGTGGILLNVNEIVNIALMKSHIVHILFKNENILKVSFENDEKALLAIHDFRDRCVKK